MSDWYVLDEHNNVVGPVQLMDGAAFMSDTKRRVVGRTTVYEGCDVSTVFLGLDHRFNDFGDPIVFETMVFGGPMDSECERYCTWAEAQAGHAKMVEKCQPIMTEDVKS